MKKSLYLFLIITIFIFSLCSCKDQKGTASTGRTTDIAETDSHSVTSENNADVGMRNKYKINLYTKAYQYRDYQFDFEDNLPLYDSVPYFNVIDEMYTRYDYYIEKMDDDALSDLVDKYDKTVRKASDNPDYYITDYKKGVCINRYVGNEKNVVIPSILDGKEVLKLGADINQGEYGFNYDLPFVDREITSITLPSTVKVIVLNTFDSFDAEYGKGYLENIYVDSENPYYTSVNGILYNKDKTCLLQIPNNYQNKTLVIPEGTKAVYSLNAYTTEKLILPSSVVSLGENYDENNQYKRGVFNDFLYYYPLETYRIGQVSNFEVSQENVYYLSQDGVLYNKDKTSLLMYPLKNKDDSFVVPDSVELINGMVDFGQSNLKSITIGENVKEIMAFFDDNIKEKLIVKGYKGTAAEKYAKQNGFKFVAI
ncbi:MAG: hypothetical protein ACI4Q8_03855 [Ruminococcus sp.]